MRDITITEGLVELKLLDKRIEKAMTKNWCAAVRASEFSEEKRKEYETEIKALYQSVNDLISERNRIKAAIVKSNATTTLKVGSEEMTVAEAIERKSSIEYEKKLMSWVKGAYSSAVNTVTTSNLAVQNKIDQMLNSMASSDKADIAEAQKVLSESYMAKNGWILLDPLNAEKEIEKLDKRIDEFEKNVDLALSLSNAVTIITV